MSVLVFIETKDGRLTKAAFEAVSYGSKIGATTVVTYGNADAASLAELGNYGATKVLVNRDVEGNDEQQLTKLVIAAASEIGADTVVLIQDQIGKAVGPRVAARLGA
ncbi:MAG: electron transfer flavoprotein alpha subunit, partial [Parvicella sp.]